MDFHESEDGEKQLKELFASLAPEPPPTSMSSLGVVAKSGHQARNRRRRWTMGVAAAVVILGVGAVLVPHIGPTSAQEETLAVTEAAQGNPNAPAPMLQTADGAQDYSGQPNSGQPNSAAVAQDATGSDTASAAMRSAAVGSAAGDGATGEVMSTAEPWMFDVRVAPEATAESADSRCLLPALPAPAQQLALTALTALPGADPVVARLTIACGINGAGNAFLLGSAAVAIYGLGQIDPCDALCFPGPTPDVRYRVSAGATTVLVTTSDARVLVLSPLGPRAADQQQGTSVDPVVLAELGRQILAATAE